MAFPDDSPRRHHYEVAHRVLPAILRRPDVDLLALAGAGRLERALAGTWEEVGSGLAVEERVPADGLTARVVERDGVEVLVVRFPPALHAAEAHFAAVAPVEPAAARRYHVLEFSWTFEGARTTVLGEWTADGSHLNRGDGPPPDEDAFVDRVVALVTAAR